MNYTTGMALGLVVCNQCRNTVQIDPTQTQTVCAVCRGQIDVRKPNSISRALAFLIAAVILYIPANLLPVMTVSTILGSEDDTIMSGVVVLVHSGSWPLGALIFFASIVVPLLKIISMTILIATVAANSRWAPLQRTRLYRLVEFVGRWSMLDIYVVTLLVGLVQIRELATITPRGGALAFAAVVVLTILSASSFESRLIWDSLGGDHD